jgi:hypothetical protein
VLLPDVEPEEVGAGRLALLEALLEELVEP